MISISSLKTEIFTFKQNLINDWQGSYLSFAAGVSILFAFSQGWLAPLFGYSGTNQSSDSFLIRFFYYPFYLLALWLAFLCWKEILNSLWRTGFLVILLVLCLVSYFWSYDPAATFRRFIALAFTSLAAFSLAARFGWPKLIEVIGFAFVILMVWSYVMGIVFPQNGRMQELFVGAWRGVWLEKNNLGANMALGVVACVAASLHNPKRRYFWALAGIGMLGLIILSTSKTSLVSIMIGLCVIGIIFLARKGPVWASTILFAAASVSIIIAVALIIDPTIALKALGKDPTLTGRIYIWQGIAHVMQDRPLLGYGYGAIWYSEGVWSPIAWITHIAGFRAYHAHSCWYEVWLNLGIVGLMFWILLVIDVVIKGIVKSLAGTSDFYALPFIAMYLLSSITESQALNWNDLRWCLFMVIIIKLSLPLDKDADLISRFVETKPQKYRRPQSKSESPYP